MRIATHLFILVACILVTAACRGRIVATAELHGEGTAEAHFQSTGAPLVLWADTDGTWRGSKDFPTAICGTHISNGDLQSGDCELKLTCTLPAIPSGDTILRVKGVPGKYAMEVKKMSINVRNK